MVLPPSFVRHRQSGVTLWVDREFVDPVFLDALAEADGLFALPTCQIVKDQKKIKVARLGLSIAGRERILYVKRYNSFSLRFKVLSPLFRSGALRSLRGAGILARGGIASARPVAALEKRKYAVLLHSFFISDEIAGGKTADAYWMEHLRSRSGPEGFRCRRRFIERLAGLFQSLHAARIYHNDLKDANILAVGRNGHTDCALFLLDLEGVRQCHRIGERRRVKNLVQLYRTLGGYLSRPQQLFFLKAYLEASFLDRGCKRRWIGRVLRRARRIDRVKGQQDARAAC
ncbi:MAG: lipopolysaccharide kinase InaA family protein [Chloroflexota bacterium]